MTWTLCCASQTFTQQGSPVIFWGTTRRLCTAFKLWFFIKTAIPTTADCLAQNFTTPAASRLCRSCSLHPFHRTQYPRLQIATMSSNAVSIKLLALLALFTVLLSPALCSPFAWSMRQDAEESAEPEGSPEPEEVCVDARYLSRYTADNLVHMAHITADVLCPTDSSLPCATANHMVRLNGKAISYAALCEERKCTIDRMQVNSVLSHKWTEQEHDNGVVLTMLDARHPETVQKSLHRLTSARRAISKKLF